MIDASWLRRRIAAALTAVPLAGCAASTGGEAAEQGDGSSISAAELCEVWLRGRENRWCGPPGRAQALAVADASEDLGCPTSLDPAKVAKDEPAFKHDKNSHKPQVILLAGAAKTASSDCGQATCCYVWVPDRTNPIRHKIMRGRPLMESGVPVTAPGRTGGAWSSRPPERVADGLGPRIRAWLAERWAADGAMEHASVASFARATLELMALGAPPELVEATQRASLDEVHHARLCYALASAYAGGPVGPGALPAVAPRPLDAAQLAVAVFEEGCVGETVAALEASHAAARCQVPAVASALRAIAGEEASHAELAWRTLAWALELGGSAARDAVDEVADRLRGKVAEPLDVPAAWVPTLRAHGAWIDREAVRLAAWEQVIGAGLSV